MKNIIMQLIIYTFLGLVVLMIIGIMASPEEPVTQLGNTTKVIEKHTAKSYEKKPHQKDKIIGKTFTINHLTEFTGYSSNLPLFVSYKDRTKVGVVSRYDKVVLINYDAVNSYCRIKKGTSKGWLMCNWLFELPEDMKLDVSF